MSIEEGLWTAPGYGQLALPTTLGKRAAFPPLPTAPTAIVQPGQTVLCTAARGGSVLAHWAEGALAVAERQVWLP